MQLVKWVFIIILIHSSKEDQEKKLIKWYETLENSAAYLKYQIDHKHPEANNITNFLRIHRRDTEVKS